MCADVFMMFMIHVCNIWKSIERCRIWVKMVYGIYLAYSMQTTLVFLVRILFKLRISHSTKKVSRTFAFQQMQMNNFILLFFFFYYIYITGILCKSASRHSTRRYVLHYQNHWLSIHVEPLSLIFHKKQKRHHSLF